GDAITGIEDVGEARVYHSGTKLSHGQWQTNGGRVLAIVAGGSTREEAVEKAHAATDKITFPGQQRRRDIGIFNF
ncbi:MAG TPA: phosphoribosylglycinamide synthetase C domain-containing protein, partial [Luteolibacter sp.]|nr:phosphoribosylglycinamide synthetase C domain-containing protein [Luteolibacter sp.]